MKVFAIKNTKLNYFNRPIFAEYEAEALSYIQNVLASDSDRALRSLADDTMLVEIGEYNSSTGVLLPNRVYLENIILNVAELLASGELHIGDAPTYVVNHLEAIFYDDGISLKDIFDSIPKERIKHRAEEMLAETNAEVAELRKRLDAVNVELSRCKKRSN